MGVIGVNLVRRGYGCRRTIASLLEVGVGTSLAGALPFTPVGMWRERSTNREPRVTHQKKKFEHNIRGAISKAWNLNLDCGDS